MTYTRKLIVSLAILFIIAILATIITAGVKLYDNIMNSNTLFHGIYINGESMENLTQEQAIEKLSKIHEKFVSEQFQIRLIYGNKEWLLGKNEMAIHNNIIQTVEKSYQIGRQGSLFDRIKAIKSLKEAPIFLESTVSYDTKELIPYIENIAKELEVKAIDASLNFFPDKKEKFTITKEIPGKRLDVNKVYNEIESSLSKGNSKIIIELELNTIEAKIKASDFDGKTEKLISFGTDLSKSNADRTHNVVKAASEFNGLIVMPGKIISFNEIVGERRTDRGYRNAPMIVADKSLENAVGGGVSQTSSTLYNAAIRSGLDVVEFRRHSFPISYLAKGLDTTVNLPTPVIDLKVKNTKDTPVYIHTYYRNKKVYFEIYGEPLPNNRTIRISTDE